MTSFETCAASSKPADDEQAPGSARLSPSLYASYLLHLARGATVVRDMIASDIRLSHEIGAAKQAADLAVVLRTFVAEHPECRSAHPRQEEGRSSAA